MNFDNCKIYKGKKRIGLLPCKLIKKTDLCDEHFLIPSTYHIKPGYILVINNKEKFYVTDVRLPHNDNTHLNVFFETVAQHKEKFIRFWIPIIISIVALLRPEITKLINYILDFITKLG